MRWAIGSTVECPSTRHAPPNDPAIVIVIIVVGEAADGRHRAGIIAQVSGRKENRGLEEQIVEEQNAGPSTFADFGTRTAEESDR